jgi:hypothetical protein
MEGPDDGSEVLDLLKRRRALIADGPESPSRETLLQVLDEMISEYEAGGELAQRFAV